jgi:putative ABC transport system ATP-binding protein
VIAEIAKIVEEACARETNVFGYGIWTHHVARVAENGKRLAKMFRADPEIVEIAALLHDYASIKDQALYQDHHVHGPIEAEKLLRHFGYPMETVVRAVGLTRRYKMGDAYVDALRGVDLTLARGEFAALVGPSGSGKSTVLNLIGGLDRPTSGEVWINGTELGSGDERTLTLHRRQHVGFVFQTFNLLPRLTAEENVALPLMFSGVPEGERRSRARALLERVSLGARLDHRPTQLSGGEQQRVAIARALVGQPALLLADEPTGNLDTVTGGEIMTLLKDLNQERGLTLLVVTHDPEVAAFADRVVKLRDGQVEQ